MKWVVTSEEQIYNISTFHSFELSGGVLVGFSHIGGKVNFSKDFGGDETAAKKAFEDFLVFLGEPDKLTLDFREKTPLVINITGMGESVPQIFREKKE